MKFGTVIIPKPKREKLLYVHFYYNFTFIWYYGGVKSDSRPETIKFDLALSAHTNMFLCYFLNFELEKLWYTK